MDSHLHNKFIISRESYTTGFQHHVMLKPTGDPAHLLERRRLYFRSGADEGDPKQLLKIIERNISLRIGFGWSFESADILKDMIGNCLEELAPRFDNLSCNLVSDFRADWIGFAPYNVFERRLYENLNISGLITFNNELCDFQLTLVKLIQNHKIYRQHLVLRDTEYRYSHFRKMRRDPDALSNAFHDMMEALHGTLGSQCYPRQVIEEMVACHFLHHPDKFFELINFYKLKGTIHE